MRLWQAGLLVALAAPLAGAQDGAVLQPDEASRLDQLAELVGPPAGARELVHAMVPEWGHTGRKDRPALGWLVGEGDEARVVFVGGVEIPAPPPEARQSVDLVAEAEAFYVRGEVAATLDPTDVGFPCQQPLVHAVWLRALGRDDLAGRALAHSRDRAGGAAVSLELQDAQLLVELREELVRQGQSRVLEAFVERADRYALAVGTWLLRHGFELQGDAPAIVSRLEVLQDGGRLGAEPPAFPAEGSEWSEARRLAWALERLPELRCRGGGAFKLSRERSVQAVLVWGDTAVPALIELVASGDTVTRWVGLVWGEGREGRLLRVREVALQLLWKLLGVNPVGSGDPYYSSYFCAVSDPVAEAEALRSYWEQFGALSLLERLLAMLESFDADSDRAELAAWALARLGAQAPDDRWRLGHARLGTESRVARAMLQAFLRGGHKGFLSALVELGDQRIAPEVAAAALREEDRRRADALAFAASLLGVSAPWLRVLDEVAAGTRSSGSVEALDELLWRVVHSGAMGTSALRALTQPGHPWREPLVVQLLDRPATVQGAWVRHPFVLALLRPLLEDSTPTGVTWFLDHGVVYREGGRHPLRESPQRFGGAGVLRAAGEERACDKAARWFAEHVMGAPQAFHALRQDRDELLAQLRDLVDRFRFRATSPAERGALGVQFVPLLPTLEGPATEDDVTRGRAVFHQADSVGPAWVQLPAVAALAGTRARVLVVQGELDAEGQVTWGVLGGPQGLAAVGQDALDGEPVPLDELLQDR